MEYEYTKRGVGNAALTTGIIGTSLGGLSLLGGAVNLLGNMAAGAAGGGTGGHGGHCGGSGGGDSVPVNRYELGLEQANAAKDSEIALLKANTYGDQKLLEVYKYFDGELRATNTKLAEQAVINQANKDSFQIMQERMDCCKRELEDKICRERDDRKCADNTIVTYLNATFYPKQVADVTVGTTSTPQVVYNPLPASNCGCGCGR